MSRRIVGPFNRVEGDLEVHLETSDGQVDEAFVVSPLYRGFEQMLDGKDPRDALVYAPRICGICSVSQSAAAAATLRAIQGVEVPLNGQLVINLIHACENVADHLTHFYMFFMPDFAREIYREESWFDVAEKRFKAATGDAVRQMLPARAQFMHIVGLLAGKWPHTLTIQPGGSTKSVDVHEKARIAALLTGFRRFLEGHLFGASLEEISNLACEDDLKNWQTSLPFEQSDFRLFLHISEKLMLKDLGRWNGHFLSYGAYEIQNVPQFAGGVFSDGSVAPFDQEAVREDLSHSWMEHRHEPRHPFDGVTIPNADADGGYSWCKAPRLNGEVVEVGALARQLVDGHPLIRDLTRKSGSNVHARVVARLLEIARIVPLMENWVSNLVQGERFLVHGELPDDAQGAGFVEAARGSLGHWLRAKNGRILNYQIVAPTTWNFSPRDSSGTPGALEQALVGAPIRKGEKDPVSVQHIVRSFDPCMVCTVH